MTASKDQHSGSCAGLTLVYYERLNSRRRGPKADLSLAAPHLLHEEFANWVCEGITGVFLPSRPVPRCVASWLASSRTGLVLHLAWMCATLKDSNKVYAPAIRSSRRHRMSCLAAHGSWVSRASACAANTPSLGIVGRHGRNGHHLLLERADLGILVEHVCRQVIQAPTVCRERWGGGKLRG